MRLVKHEGVFFMVSHEAEDAIETASKSGKYGLGYLLHESHNRWFNHIRPEENPANRIVSFRIGYSTFTVRETTMSIPVSEELRDEMCSITILYVTQSAAMEDIEFLGRIRA